MDKNLTLKTIDGFKISTTLTEENRNDIVLWLHGITVNKDEYLNFFKDGAKYLASHGIDSLRIDFRGHGKSSGSSLDFTIVGQMYDIQSALTYLEEKYDLSKTNLHIIGCSFGAPPAIFALNQYPNLVKSISLIAPVVSYLRTFVNPETEWAKNLFNNKTLLKFEKTKKLFLNDDFCIGPELIGEMKLIRPDEYLINVNHNVLIIHGNKDSMVPYAVSKEVSERNNTIKFITIENMDHGFTDYDDEIGNNEKSLNNKKYIYELIKNHIHETKL